MILSDIEGHFSCLRINETFLNSRPKNIALLARMCLHMNHKANMTYSLNCCIKTQFMYTCAATIKVSTDMWSQCWAFSLIQQLAIKFLVIMFRFLWFHFEMLMLSDSILQRLHWYFFIPTIKKVQFLNEAAGVRFHLQSTWLLQCSTVWATSINHWPFALSAEHCCPGHTWSVTLRSCQSDAEGATLVASCPSYPVQGCASDVYGIRQSLSLVSNWICQQQPSTSTSSFCQRLNFIVPRTRTKFGDRAFTVAGLTIWNSLLESVRSAETLC